MPDYKPNQIVRVVAVMALIAALVLVVIVVATTHGGSGGSGGGGTHKSTIGKAGRRALHKGAWIVQRGDTLGEIALKTGIDVDTLIRLNPNIDPQALFEGQRIALR